MGRKPLIMKKKVEEEVKVEEKPVKKAAGRPKKAEAVEVKAEPKKKALGKKKTEEKEDTKVVGRGRPKGVSYRVNDEYEEEIIKAFEEMEEFYNKFATEVGTYIENGSKAACKRARENLMKLMKSGKPFRKILQESKASMKQV